MQSAAQTGEKAVAGVTNGLIGPGQTVTFEGRHFGFMLKHETLITTYERPRHFQDVMVKGAFREFMHDHFFASPDGKTTVMRDELRFRSPLGILGKLMDKVMLGNYLTKFLLERNAVIKKAAESEPEVWLRFVAQDRCQK